MNYTIKHVAINHDTDEAARATAERLEYLFGQPRQPETSYSIFTGTLFEVMKPGGKGQAGHIALQVEDMDAAIADLTAKGVEFVESSIRRDENGKITFLYLKEEFAGLALHLTV